MSAFFLKVVWIRERVRKERRGEVPTILDEVVPRQTLQARGTCKALCEKKSDCRGKSFPLLCLPLVDVLQERRKRVLLERLLEVFVSESFPVSPVIPMRWKDWISPPD